MVLEQQSNTVIVTNLLRKLHPGIYNTIATTCNAHNIEVIEISGANDLWCRDFMPVQVQENKFVQFKFNPSYYQHPSYRHLQTDVDKISFKVNGELTYSDIVLDGGNLCYHQNRAILTDKVFKDNSHYSRQDLLKRLYYLLEVEEIIIIPAMPYELTGHADGIIRFIDDKTVLLNDLIQVCSKTYWNKLRKVLDSKFEAILLPNDLHFNKSVDDATGDYINMLIIQDLVFVPVYSAPTDEAALNIIKEYFNDHILIPIQCNKLAVEGGALHCATWNYMQITTKSSMKR